MCETESAPRRTNVGHRGKWQTLARRLSVIKGALGPKRFCTTCGLHVVWAVTFFECFWLFLTIVDFFWLWMFLNIVKKSQCFWLFLTATMIDLDFVTRRTLRARSRLKLNRWTWAQTFWIENDIGYNICKNDKSSWNGCREFKILLQEKGFFNVDFLIHCELLKIMRDNLTSTSVKFVALVVTSMRK